MKPILFCVTSFASLVAFSSIVACGGGVARDDDSSSSDAIGVKHCGGLAGTLCAAGYDCVDDPSDSCDPAHGGADCIGICVAPSHDGGTTTSDAGYRGCGGFTNIQCPAGETCIDDPRDNCDPNAGGADCPGVCSEATPGPAADAGAPTTSDAGYRGCGGFTNIQCPAGQTCVDDPRDNCDPAAGGADCPGVCQ